MCSRETDMTCVREDGPLYIQSFQAWMYWGCNDWGKASFCMVLHAVSSNPRKLNHQVSLLVYSEIFTTCLSLGSYPDPRIRCAAPQHEAMPSY